MQMVEIQAAKGSVFYPHTSGYLLGIASGAGSSVQADLHLGLAVVLFLIFFFILERFSFFFFSPPPPNSSPICDREL